MENEFKNIAADKIDRNVFSMIGKEWMLISATDGKKTNAMTASWGGMGVLWNKNVVYIFIRPQRYTKEFVDASDSFTLSFFDEKYREKLTYFGRISGRDEDKIKNSQLSVKTNENDVVFTDANLNIICRKLYASNIEPDGFLEKALIDANYKNADFHTMYVGEIKEILIRE